MQPSQTVPDDTRAPISEHGMVATAHAYATDAGLHILAEGGNAVDAAVAAAGVLGVVQPMMSGIGGETFMLLYDARRKQVTAINGSGPAPRIMSRNRVLELGHKILPMQGVLASSVPGAIDTMSTAAERFGSGRFTLAGLLAPAIRFAEEGAVVTPAVARFFEIAGGGLANFESSKRVFWGPNGKVEAGQKLRQPELARSLRLIAHEGARAFYTGEIAARIADYSKAHGGLLTAEDLTTYHCEIADPISIPYRGYTIYSNPPVSQGIVLLEALGILNGFDFSGGFHDSGDVVHTMVESIKLAFADRNAHIGDPLFHRNPTTELLSAQNLRKRQARIAERVMASEQEAAPDYREGDTTAIMTADRDGNMASVITSLSAAFGCSEVVEGTGILLNNRISRGFRLEPGHANSLAPGKRPMSTLHPYLIVGSDGAFAAGGCAGGDGQPQWNLQIISQLLDFDRDVQDAIDAPRWESFPGSDPEALGSPYRLRFDGAFNAATIEALQTRGHNVVAEPLNPLSASQVIVRRDGFYFGGADPRTDSVARGL